MTRNIIGFALIALLAAPGCTSTQSNLPAGAEAYKVIPSRAPDAARQDDYRIGPLDVLAVTIFREPDLSVKDLQVDAAGNLLFPLVGSIHAGGQTAEGLSKEIGTRLDSYLVNPQVSVVVTSSVSQQVTVEGNVTEPGVYDIAGSTTLLQALAKAKSPTRVARLDQVVIFRNVNGVRTGAVFNVNRIRGGQDPDPELIGGDVVVVGFSGLKGAFRDFLSAAPVLNIFRVF